jgi:hypothetical protein
MNRTLAFRVTGVIVLACFLAACSLPISSTPTISFPTADQAQTLTAVFHIPPTSTPIPAATQAQTASTGTRAAGAATLTPTISPTAANCTNLAGSITDVTIPDNTYITPGTTFTKTWSIKNIGTCTWGTGYALAFDHGDQMGGATTVPITTTVAPQSTISVSVSLTAPTVSATYQGFWKLQSPQNVKFGYGTGGANAFWVLITTNPSAATAAYVPVGPYYTAVPACVSHNYRPSGNGAQVEAFSFGSSIPPVVVNGVLDEWDATLPYTIDNHVWHKSGLSNDSDHATFSLKWDTQYLYIAVHVIDNMFMQRTEGNGSTMYNGDSLEILLDTDLQGDYCNHYLNADDYQLGLSPGDLVPAVPATPVSGPGMYLWNPTSKIGIVANTTTGSQIASATTGDGYIIEARLSWGIFDLPAQNIVGRIFGFAMSVSDNDDTGANVQERMISNDPNRDFTDPTTWSTMQLEGRTGP